MFHPVYNLLHINYLLSKLLWSVFYTRLLNIWIGIMIIYVPMSWWVFILEIYIFIRFAVSLINWKSPFFSACISVQTNTRILEVEKKPLPRNYWDILGYSGTVICLNVNFIQLGMCWMADCVKKSEFGDWHQFSQVCHFVEFVKFTDDFLKLCLKSKRYELAKNW